MTAAAPAWDPAEDGLTARIIRAGDVQMDTVVAGPAGGRRLAILLHGFPELNLSWRAQIPALVAAGWEVWAPNQRGYGGTTRPPRLKDYAPDRLVEDIVALIAAARAEAPREEIVLVAHDWGGAVGWQMAIRHADLLSGLVMMNMPHPTGFKRAIRYSAAQRKRSWYILFFQLPRLPHWLLARRGGAAVRRLFADTTTAPDRFPAWVLDRYAAAVAPPGAARAMVNWYRAAIRNRRQLQGSDGGAAARVDLPVLLLWGDRDGALGHETLDGIETHVPDLERHHIPDASHWVQQDRPDEVNRLMLDWLARRF
ncbi:MAG: alpha/beta hydrolase [Pseudomonadota bacterium]